MAQAEDLTGKEFGFLRVISQAPDRITPSGQKRKHWLCECLLCGTCKEISAQNLKNGKTKSCGCYQAIKGKAARNVKICVECGRSFECPPSENKVTCSKKCQKIHARKRMQGKHRSEETKKKISSAARGRDMSNLQAVAIDALKSSPKSGCFETNVNAKEWELVSPEGKQYHFLSLNFWLRENCNELFGCEPDSREYKNVRSGLSHAKSAMLGKISPGQRPCCTYKGWKVIPTQDDVQEDDTN